MPLTNKLILGTVQFGLSYGINNQKGKPGFNEVCNILDEAFEAGITILDTAPAYGDAIKIIGKYHELRENKFSVINKFHVVNSGNDISRELVSTLEILQIPFVEAYLFHSYQDYLANQPILKFLIKQKEEARIKKIGVSIYTNEQLIDIIERKNVDLVQLPYNLLDNENQRGDLIRRAKDKGLTIHVRSAFLQGVFFMNPDTLPYKLLPLSPYLKQIRNLADETNVSISALALQYVLKNKFIDGVIIGIDSVNQLRQNIKMTNCFVDEAIFSIIDKIVVEESELLNPVNWN